MLRRRSLNPRHPLTLNSKPLNPKTLNPEAVQSVAPAVGDLQYALGQAFGNGAATVVGNMLGEGGALGF